MVQLTAGSAEDLDGALTRLGIAPVAVGGVALRDLCGVDRGLVARWSETSVHLMPHGGAAVVKGIAGALVRAGIEECAAPNPRAVYPEAESDIEARMLATLARAASPLAVDLLLSQPARWKEGRDVMDEAQARRLCHVITPPLVVAMGPPNVGKSSLVNALAGRHVSIVADEPGTTRDHVGVMIDMAGLVVRYIDTPGLREAPGAIEAEAARIAANVAAGADLILRCGDAGAGPPETTDRESVTVALRKDLGVPAWGHDAVVSAKTGEGIAALAGLIRERLVPRSFIEDPRAWRFWE